MKFHKTWVCQEDLLKSLDISSATARVSPVMLKALVIISDKMVKISAVESDLKPYQKL